MLAAKAYEFYNATLFPTGLRIRTPETVYQVAKTEVPLWVTRMGGVAVVKVPYSNAGQGVYTITSAEELAHFMELEHDYEQYIVQSLVGNSSWSSRAVGGNRQYHVGTVPDRKGRLYASDIRFMAGNGPEGFFPVSVYARRARKPMTTELAGKDSWEMLGTNLSVRGPDGSWTTESERLVLMDSRDFNRLGIGLDDLIEAYMQTVLAMTAVDRMAASLLTKSGKFRRKFFASLNPDQGLMEEVTT
jgi:hypothetical protein